MKLRLAQPKLLVDIGRIPDLTYVRRENGVLAIGALATYRDIRPLAGRRTADARAGRGSARGR